MLYFSNPNNIEQIRYKKNKWEIKPIYKGIYVDKKDEVETIIQTNFLKIIEHLYWKCALAGVTALTFRPQNNLFFVRWKYARDIEIAGFHFISLQYHKDDLREEYKPFYWQIYTPSLELALLENFQQLPSWRVIKLDKITEYIANNIDKINIEKMKKISQSSGKFNNAFSNFMIEYGKLKGTQKVDDHEMYIKIHKSWCSIDNNRIAKFQLLHDILQKFNFNQNKPINFFNPKITQNYCFWESFYSNYIEWTRFSIEDAYGILEKWIVETRPKDSHDFLDNYNFISKLYPYIFQQKYKPQINTADEFIEYVKNIHKKLTTNTLNEDSWVFKKVKNMAWVTVFVDPEKVEWTLRMAHHIANDLNLLQKALYFHCVITEVHPFIDWNGRTSRIVLNSLLIAAGYNPIIITNEQRDYYLKAVREFSLNNNAKGYVERMDDMHTRTSFIDFTIPVEFNPLRNGLLSYEEKVALERAKQDENNDFPF